MEITLFAEKIGQAGILPITNTLLVSWIVVAFLSISGFLAGRKLTLVPSNLQNIAEAIISPILDLCENLAESKTAVFFPFIMTFFLYIMISNWFGLFPGFGTIGFWEGHKFVPFLRSINADLNMTLGLAIISALVTHIFAIYYLGLFGYLKKWFSLNPVFLFVGLLELISEITKMLSLSLRLFGNIFAGEVVLSTISSLLAFIVPLPFYFLEIIVGIVQAAVFSILTLVFMVLMTEKHSSLEH